MSIYIRTFLKQIVWLILLPFWSTLFAQNQGPIQSTQETKEIKITIPAPAAVPLLTSEEAEEINKEAVLAFEEYMHDQEILFQKTIVQRNKHHFLGEITFFVFILIHLSFVGYSNCFRRMLKIHWTNVVMFEACALAVIMLVSGMIHFMKQCAYILELIGLFLIFIQVFKERKKWRVPSWKDIHQTIFREEYIWLFFITLILFIILLSFKTELGSAPDHWNAWYDQFFYIALNDRWADSGYHNYASAYAMIVNGVAYYFASLFNNSSTQFWYYGYCWFSVMMLMPLFRHIKWHNLPFYEILFFTFCLICYRTISEKKLSDNLLFWASIILVVMHIVFSEKRKELFNNSIMYFLSFTLLLYLFFLPVHIFFYLPDTTLGCATVGLFFCTAWGLLYCHDIINWKLWLYLLPLAVLSLIKPTGVIPALLISVFFVLCVLVRSLRSIVHIYKRKRTKTIVFYLIMLTLVAASPLTTNGLWNIYAKHNGLTYQHTISPMQLLSQATDQIKNGISLEEENEWKSKITHMSLWGSSKGKSMVESKLDKLFFCLFNKYPYLDIDQSFSTYPLKSSHVFVVSILLVLYSFFIILFIKKKIIYLFLLIWVLFTYFVFVFNQYYITPMFTAIPGAFRYFYPAFSLVLGISFLGSILLFSENRLYIGLICCIFLFCIMGRKPFSVQGYSKVFDTPHSSVGYSMLAAFNSTPDVKFRILYGQYTRETDIFNYLIRANLLDSKIFSSVIRTIPDIIDSPFLVLVGPTFSFSHDKTLPRLIVPNSQNGVVEKPGIYIADPKMVIKDDSSPKSPQRIQLVELFSNSDAISLMNNTYYLSDLNSWRLPPWIEINNIDSNGNMWLIPPLNQSFIQKGHNMITVSPSPNGTRFTLWDTTYKFCFAQDSIRFVGKYSKDMRFSLVLGLYEKSDSNQRYTWIKQYPINITSVSSINKKENEFKADLNLADIPTDKLNLYYRIGIVLEPGTEGTMRDFHLYQYVSGKLNLKQAFAELEQIGQTVETESAPEVEAPNSEVK